MIKISQIPVVLEEHKNMLAVEVIIDFVNKKESFYIDVRDFVKVLEILESKKIHIKE